MHNIYIYIYTKIMCSYVYIYIYMSYVYVHLHLSERHSAASSKTAVTPAVQDITYLVLLLS